MASYKVVFLGLSVIGPEEEARLLKGLQKRFNLTPEKAESLLQRVPVVVKKGIPRSEAERYVKVFEEIGGKVRMEEEIQPGEMDQTYERKVRSEPETPTRVEPSYQFEYGPESEKKVYPKEMITCPQCGFEQPETDECIKCGVVISKYVKFQEMARSIEPQVREISAEAYVPWESGEGFIQAFYRTMMNSLFSPGKFFKKISAGEGYWSPLIYGLITGIIGNGFAILWFWLLMAQWIPIERLPFHYGLSILQIIIPLPFQEAIAIFIGSTILHLCLILVRGNHHGYKTTFRAVAYSYSGYLFGIIPIIGIFIGVIYVLILTIIGMKEGHEISTGKAVLAVLLPIIVIFGIITLGIILSMLLFGSLSFLGGVRI